MMPSGLAVGRSALALYDDRVPIPTADGYFPKTGACRAISVALQPLKTELPAWYIVGRNDDLQRSLIPAVRKHGYRCFKLKTTGSDNSFDIARTIEVYRTAVDVGASRPRLSIDSNEGNSSAESVLEFLGGLKFADTEAYAAVEYLEQPTDRDIRSTPFDWRAVARKKPVLLDEGLTDLTLLDECGSARLQRPGSKNLQRT